MCGQRLFAIIYWITLVMDSCMKNSRYGDTIFKLSGTRKMSIAILKIPQPMILLTTNTPAKSCDSNKNDSTFTSYDKNKYNGTDSSLIKLDRLPNSQSTVKFTDESVTYSYQSNHFLGSQVPFSEEPLVPVNTSPKLIAEQITCSQHTTDTPINSDPIPEETKVDEPIETDNPDDATDSDNTYDTIENNNIDEPSESDSSDSDDDPSDTDTVIISDLEPTGSNNFNLFVDNRIHTATKSDKCVDTSDIDNYSSSQHIYNILDHLNEAENLLKIEREKRFNQIRREYSLVRDKIEEKFHLLISICNKRKIDLNSKYLERLEDIKNGLYKIKLPKLNHIKSKLNQLLI